MFSNDSWKPIALFLAVLALVGIILLQALKLPDLPAPSFLFFSVLFLLGAIGKQLWSLHKTFPDNLPSQPENPAKILTAPLEDQQAPH